MEEDKYGFIKIDYGSSDWRSIRIEFDPRVHPMERGYWAKKAQKVRKETSGQVHLITDDAERGVVVIDTNSTTMTGKRSRDIRGYLTDLTSGIHDDLRGSLNRHQLSKARRVELKRQSDMVGATGPVVFSELPSEEDGKSDARVVEFQKDKGDEPA